MRELITSGDPEYDTMVGLAEGTSFSSYRRQIVYQERLWRVYRDEEEYRFYLVKETNKRRRQLGKFYETEGLDE